MRWGHTTDYKTQLSHLLLGYAAGHLNGNPFLSTAMANTQSSWHLMNDFQWLSTLLLSQSVLFAYAHSLILLVPFLILFFQFVSILTYLTATHSSKPSFSYFTPVFMETAFLTRILAPYSLISFDAYTDL